MAIICFLITACTSEKTPRDLAIEEIKTTEAAMHQNLELNDLTATAALKAYENFVSQFPKDDLSPDFLFKSAEISTSSKQFDKALNYYKQIIAQYPNYKLIQESYFLQASLLDNYMERDGQAKMVYEELIEKFPKSNYANDAKAAIANLGLTDKELIEEFKKKNNN